MSEMLEDELLARVTAGDIRTASRLISRAEAGDRSITPVLKQLSRRAKNGCLLGITGPPGAGKSTLLNQLIVHYRQLDQQVAVLAVDPSSPFSGGAILGDRVRMNQHAADPKVFIRSMAARGQLGGLASACGDVLTILSAMNFDIVLLETVGVGQNEVDIMRYATQVVVVQTPGAGDRVQSVKAGILEIGDIYVVNKADMPGADQLVTALQDSLQLSHQVQKWLPPVIAIQASSGMGINALVEQIAGHQAWLASNQDTTSQRARQRLRYRIAEICKQRLGEVVVSGAGVSEQEMQALLNREQDPYSVAEQLLKAG